MVKMEQSLQMIKRNFWFGPEVEGRLSGIMTVFVRFSFPEEKIIEQFPHVYLTIEFCRDNGRESPIWDLVRTILFGKKKMVTAEIGDDCLENIPADIFNACHVLLRTKCPSISRLKPLDTVTIDIRPYNVFCVTKSAMQHVTPEKYSSDFE